MSFKSHLPYVDKWLFVGLRVVNGSRMFFVVKRLEVVHYENKVTNERQKLIDK